MITLALLSGCGGSVGTKAEGIVSLAPHLTEFVFALGRGHRVVGVSNFDDYPPEVRGLPKVGHALSPDIERIAELAPSLILSSEENSALSLYAATEGVSVVYVPMDTLAAISEGIVALGKALGCPARAQSLQTRMAETAEQLRRAFKDQPRPRVLVVNQRRRRDLDAVRTFGGASFVSEIIELVGGWNVFADVDKAHLEVAKETIVAACPEVILECSCRGLTQRQQDGYFSDWRACPDLPAIKSGRVFFIIESHALRPGPRVFDLARLVAGLLHPEVELPHLSLVE